MWPILPAACVSVFIIVIFIVVIVVAEEVFAPSFGLFPPGFLRIVLEFLEIIL